MTGIFIVVFAIIAFGVWQAWMDAKGRERDGE